MKLSDYVIQYLADLGIEHVFVVYGAAIGDLIDSFRNVNGTKYICVLHEQAGAMAVDAYSRISGKLGAAIVTSGPGGTNLLTGIACAWYESTPCIFITGQINTRFIKTIPEVRQVGFQENDIVAMSKPITKFAVLVRKAEDIKYLLDKAVFLARNGRPGPVLLDIPMDIQKMEIRPKALRGFEPGPDDLPKQDSETELREKVKECVASLQAAQRPVLLLGGGIWLSGATSEVRELADALKIPVIETWNALDVLPSAYQWYRGRVGTFGGAGRNFAVQNSDLLLSIGSRISGRLTGGMVSTFARGAKRIIVDIDAVELAHQQVKGHLNICSDAKRFIRSLLKELSGVQLPHISDWRNRTLEWRNKYVACLPEYYEEKERVNPYVFIKVLSEELSEGDIIFHDCGGNTVVTCQTFETKKGQRLISDNGHSAMGYSFAASMGACFVPGVKRVVCIIGDGGFNMNIQELQTVKHYGLPVKTFIVNNYGYGITKMYQDTYFGSRYEACEEKSGFSSPDFIKVVQAYGIKTEVIQDHRELREKIRAVLKQPDAVVCDVRAKDFHEYRPRLGWSSPIEDQHPFLPRDEFRKNMVIEPLEGWEDPVYPGRA